MPSALWTVYIASGLISLLYTYTLFRVISKAKSYLLIFMIIILIMFNISCCVWQKANNTY